MGAIADTENLRLAFWKAARGKSGQGDVQEYRARFEKNITELRRGLLIGDYPIGKSHRFIIFEPKRREINAAAFPERVLHHALMNICEPIFERATIFDTYACRKGKGHHAAIQRARGFCGRYGWFLKMDIRKYFDSIDHAILLNDLRAKFKDCALLRWFERLLQTYHLAPGKGLPIGNLTSQHFANFYLDALDRFIKENLRALAYVRYMDDFVLWSNDRGFLRSALGQIERFLSERLKLAFKPVPYLNRTGQGMNFLGYRLFPDRVELSRQSKRRFIRKLKLNESACREGRIDERRLQRNATALLAFVQSADSMAFRTSLWRKFWGTALWLEPRDSRGQLEQQREQLPGGQPQQQHAVQPQHQHRVPPGPSSTHVSEEQKLTRPPSCPVPPEAAPAKTEGPRGVSRLEVDVLAERSARADFFERSSQRS